MDQPMLQLLTLRENSAALRRQIEYVLLGRKDIFTSGKVARLRECLAVFPLKIANCVPGAKNDLPFTVS
jgi:hypothetical protein